MFNDLEELENNFIVYKGFLYFLYFGYIINEGKIINFYFLYLF